MSTDNRPDIREIKFLEPPTKSQLVALLGIREHGHPWAYCFGRSQHGGFSLVVSVILKRGWATGDTTTWTLTERGKKLLEALEDPT